jgi:dTDP-4-amino-4,6-dideoxy-D-glucose/dTDP-4-amino-2,4-dideoxy-beta-L-xylose transaminase
VRQRRPARPAERGAVPAGRLLRWFGIDRGADRVRGDYDVPEWGYRFQMNEISGAIGLANLGAVDALVERHRANATFYTGS